jgi:apolipoprotein N-acyltransferase
MVIVSAILTNIAYPWPDLGIIAWVSLIPMLLALFASDRPHQAIGRGYLFGLIHWGWTTTWIGATVVHWAGSSVGWIAWVGLTLIESGWYALFGFLAWLIFRRSRGGMLAPIALAGAWTFIEWLRGLGSLAMPWALLGYTQYKFLPLIQIADLGGVLLVTFLVVLWNGSLALCLLHYPQEKSLPHTFRPIISAAIVIMAALCYGAFCLHKTYDGPQITAALMQPNEESDRVDFPVPSRSFSEFRELLSEAELQPERLVIWPESIAPGDAVNDPFTRKEFASMARESDSWQFAGTGYEDNQGRPYNSAALFNPEGHLSGRYDKTWLVPYGEWIPGRNWMPFASVFHFPQYDDVPGKNEHPLGAGNAKLCPLICYETAFASLCRLRVNQGANIIVSLTNDSWAGKSKVQWQHAAMGVFRAIESRRAFVASSTTGVTCAINPAGISNYIPLWRPGALVQNIPLETTRTFYDRWGDWIALVSFFLMLAGITGIRSSAKLQDWDT